MQYDIKDLKQAPRGLNRILWAEKGMPVLSEIKRRFEREKPLKNIQIGACLHVTTETANLARTLKAAGARVALCASNPLSTQDDTAASLVKDFGIEVFAVRGESTKKYYEHINSVLDRRPIITLDDGADLIGTVHKSRNNLAGTILASFEETTTGLVRLKAMARQNTLKLPVFAINDARVKFLFDNRYGTGQSTLDGIIRATNTLLAGKTVAVCGYGWCGRGFAMRARAMGAKVIITEVDPVKALEAAMDGYAVMPIKQAAKVADIFCTITGNKNVITKEHFLLMKDGAILCNSGHFNVELDLDALSSIAKKIKQDVRPNVNQYILKNGRSIFLLAQGRLVNLACAEGHPAEVMDMSFSTQALTVEYVCKLKERLKPAVYNVPAQIETWIASLKLKTMGIEIDKLTPEQVSYMESWQEGT